MSYRNPQDVAAERRAQAEREQDRALAETRAEQAAFTESCRGLYGDARAQKGDQLVRAECTHAGIVNERDIQEAQARVRERDATLLQENPELTPQEYVNILAASHSPLTAEQLKAREELLIGVTAIPVYRTAGDVRALITEANKALPVERPILNERLRQGGGSTSLPVLRTLIDQAAGRKDVALRALAAGKPFGRVPAPAKPADPGAAWPFK
jgi:hypothetical protein